MIIGNVGVEMVDDQPTRRIAIEGIELLAEARRTSVRIAEIELDALAANSRLVDRIAGIVGAHPGACRVHVRLRLGAHSALLELPNSYGVDPTDSFISAVADAVGDDVVALR